MGVSGSCAPVSRCACVELFVRLLPWECHGAVVRSTWYKQKNDALDSRVPSMMPLSTPTEKTS